MQVTIPMDSSDPSELTYEAEKQRSQAVIRYFDLFTMYLVCCEERKKVIMARETCFTYSFPMGLNHLGPSELNAAQAPVELPPSNFVPQRSGHGSIHEM
jgi:hypothetical protein